MRNSAVAVREYEGVQVPEAGTYVVDASHSTVEFVARHLMITKVRGRFNEFEGTVVIGQNPLESSVEASIKTASLDTADAKRDEHLRTSDFFGVEQHPTIDFRSTEIEKAKGGQWKLTGDLTVRGVTRPVELDLEFDGSTVDPWGGQRIAFSASADVDREDWGLTWNVALETGGVLVGRKVRLELNIQAVRQA